MNTSSNKNSEVNRYSLKSNTITRWIDIFKGQPVACGYFESWGQIVEWEGPDRALRDYIEELTEEGIIYE